MVKNITFNDGNSIPQLGYGVWQIEDNGAADAVGSKRDTATLIPHPFMGTRLG